MNEGANGGENNPGSYGSPVTYRGQSASYAALDVNEELILYLKSLQLSLIRSYCLTFWFEGPFQLDM